MGWMAMSELLENSRSSQPQDQNKVAERLAVHPADSLLRTWYVAPHDPPNRTPVLYADLPATLAYYRDKLGFECLSTWQDPPVYAIVARDQRRSTSGAPSHLRRILTSMMMNCSTRTCSLTRRRGCTRVRGSRCRIHANTWRYAVAIARIRREGLRWPPPRFRRESGLRVPRSNRTSHGHRNQNAGIRR